MQKPPDHFVSALSHYLLTPLYDSVIRWTMPELRIKREMVRQLRIRTGHRVLDLGCGTATLTLLAKKTHPNASVVGLDGDAKILAIASKKAKEAGLEISLDEGMAFHLPFADASYDRVMSSLVFHHMTRVNKTKTLLEAYRVLRAGGELHIADYGKPQNLLMAIASLPGRLLDGKTSADNVKGLLPEFIRQAGFLEVYESARFSSAFGTVSLYSGRKPT